MNAQVVDAQGLPLSPCAEERARALVAAGKAELLSETPLLIRLSRVVARTALRPRPTAEMAGKRVLVHICCAPCATYSVQRLREEGMLLTGHWFNPNVHPFEEHEKRRESLTRYADEIALPVLWEEGDEAASFWHAIAGHERFRERCTFCYRLRLERTARLAAARGEDAFTSTLLISPYQDQAALRRIGEELGKAHGVPFYYENLRRGYAERTRLAIAHQLYLQHYCGCSLSEAEMRARASAPPRREG
jgi:hypothetical protein